MPVTGDDIKRANVRFFQKFADNYEEMAPGLYSARETRYMQNLIAGTIPDHLRGKNPSVLDVGTGTGYLLDLFKPHTTSVVAMDITVKMISLAESAHPDVLFLRADAAELPFKPGSFDIVVCNAMLHHLYDYRSFIQTVLPLVRKGGTLFIGHEPNYYFWRSFFWIGKYTFDYLYKDDKIFTSIKQKGDEDDMKLAEYHQYYTSGIHPRVISRMLGAYGFGHTAVHYSNISMLKQFSKLARFGIDRIFPDHFGPYLSANFNIIAKNLNR